MREIDLLPVEVKTQEQLDIITQVLQQNQGASTEVEYPAFDPTLWL